MCPADAKKSQELDLLNRLAYGMAKAVADVDGQNTAGKAHRAMNCSKP